MQKKSLEKIQASTGFKCMAPRYKFATATNWATKPHIGGEAHLEVSFFLWRNFIIIFIENFDQKKMGPLTSKTKLTVWGAIRGKVTLCLSQDDNKNNKIDHWTFVLKKKKKKTKRKRKKSILTSTNVLRNPL